MGAGFYVAGHFRQSGGDLFPKRLKGLVSALGALLSGFIFLALVNGPEGAADQLLTLTIVAAAIGFAQAKPKLAYLPVMLALLVVQWPLAAPDDSIAAALAGRSQGLVLAAEKAAAAGQVDAAEGLLDRAVRANPRYGKAKATAAALHLAMGQTDKAYELASAALKDYERPIFTIARTRPDGAKNVALFVAGKAAAQFGYYDDALVRLTQAALADPVNGLIHWELAGIFAKDGLWKEAADAYERVIAAAGSVDRTTVAQAYRLRGEALARMGRVDDALASLQTSLARNPDDALARLDVGAIKLAQGRVNEAMGDLRVARDKLLANGDPAAEQAEQLLDRAYQFIYEGYKTKGRSLLASRDYQGAVQWLKRAIALAPPSDRAELDLSLAQAYWNLDRLEEAIASYREAAATDPRNPRTRHSLGWALGAIGQFKEAEAEVKAAITMYASGAPELPSAHSLLGVIYELTGRGEAARAEYLTALSLDPSDVRARANLDRVVRAAQVIGTSGE